MATKKKSSSRKSSSGSDPKSKRIVRGKMEKTMHEFKHHDLKSGRSGKNVKNRKQAIAIGLSEARRSGADIPKKGAAKKKSTSKKSSGTKSSGRKSSGRKLTGKKTARR